MSTQTGSISFESTNGLHSYAKQNYATLSQIKGQFATCGTSASTAAKVATIVPTDSGWELYTGATVTVKFTNANTATTPTLNVNSSGAKEIRDYAGNILTKAAREWLANSAIALTYDGTYWRIQDSNLMERVHNAETSIDQTATSITSLAAMNDNYTDPSGNTVTNNMKSYVNQTANSITQTVSNTYATKTELSNASSAAEITKSSSGQRTIITEDAAELPLIDLTAYGECVQDGTPTPDAPQEIVSVRPLNRFSKSEWINGSTIIPGSMSAGYLSATYYDDTTAPAGYFVRFSVVDDTKTATAYITNMHSRCNMIHGETYVASVWMRANRSITEQANKLIIEAKSSSTDLETGYITTEWRRFSVRFVYNENSTYQALYLIYLTDAAATTIGDYIDIGGIQITFGQNPHDYIPYGHISVISNSRNLISLPSWEKMSSYPKPSSYYNYPLFLEPNTTYYLSTTYDASGNPKNGGYLLVSKETSNINWKSIGHASSGKSDGTLTTGADGILYLNFYGTQEQYEYFLEHATPQLEKGIAATAYEPYWQNTSYIDLKGHELHGLDETYRDILRIDANGHAIIEKRTKKITWDDIINFSSNSSRTNCSTNSNSDVVIPAAAEVPLLLSSYLVAHQWSGTTIPGTSFLNPSGGAIGWNFDPGVAENLAALKATYPGVYSIHPLLESAWYTIDLGYIDLPRVTDGSTVHVAAEVQPIIDGNWWTKAGESVGKLSQSTKDNTGSLKAPYTEVEWVESNGTQYVYTDWKPPIATWGFDIDFQNKNAVTTSVGAWRSDTNVNGYGTIFGTRNASNVNNTQLSSYSNGVVRVTGNSNTSNHGFKTDKTRQHMSYIGTTFTKPNGTTMTVNRGTETANKFYANMTIFACHEGVRRASTGNLIEPSTTRIYSLKFYEGTEVVMDLVGAIRNKDGITGLYDKIKNHFYPAPDMTYGNTIGVLGKIDTLTETIAKQNIQVRVDNRTVSRMWEATVPELDRLEDGQQITVTFMTTIGSTTPNAVAAAGINDFAGQWDETVTTSYSNVYLKLILKDGSKTEWIPCFYSSGTRLTSHYAAGTPVLLTYRENVFYGATTTSAGSSTMRAWYANPDYNSDTYGSGYQKYFSGKTGSIGVWAGSLFMEDGNGTYQNICTASDGTVTSASSGAGARTTSATKIANPNGFKVGSTIYYAQTSYNANTNISGWGAVLSYNSGLFDSRYCINSVLTTNFLTPYKPLYLVGTISEGEDGDGLFYLDTIWWTQIPNDTSKVYILVGGVYDSSTSYCRITLYEKNPWYVYDGEDLVEFAYSRITKNQTDIIQTNESITTTAASTLNTAKSYADGKVAQEVLDRNSAIEQSASSITSTVSANYTTKTEFNNLEIGGRNLYLQTKAHAGSAWHFGANWVIDENETYNGFIVRKKSGQWGGSWQDIYLNNGDQVTISFWAKADLGAHICSVHRNLTIGNVTTGLRLDSIYPLVEGTTTEFIDASQAAVDWTYCTATLTATQDNVKLGWRIEKSNSGGDSTGFIYLCGFKLEKGNRATDWSPAPEDLEAYTDTQVSSAESRITQTTDNITSEVSKINSAKYVNSSTASWTLANIKTYAAEGYDTNFNVTSTSNIRVGDTVYIKGTDSTRNCTVYIKTTVRAINSATQLATTSHGYEDVLPVETIKSTINQSADSVKIQAKHIEIDGTATFKNGNTTTTLGEYLDETYDAAGAADAVANVASTAALEEQYIYISKTSGTNSVSGNTTWVATNSDSQNTWTTKRPTYNSSYPVLFIAKQKKTVGGTVTCTTPVKDDTTTIIDGGHITTGTIDASVVTVNNINASNITAGTLSADRIQAGSLSISKLSDLEVGGTNLIWNSSQFRQGSVQSNSTMAQSVEDGLYKMIISSGNTANYNSSWWATNFAGGTNDINNILSIGEKYTVSMLMKAEGSTKPPTLHLNSTNGYKQLNGTLDSSKWTTVFYTFTFAANGTGQPHLGWSSINVASTYYIKAWKIEKGTVPTAWSPAPEDTDAAINEVQQNLDDAVDNMSSYTNSIRTWYAECSTVAATAAKVATINPVTTDFTTSILTPGTVVFVKFTVTNSAAVGDLTLNVNGTGAKPIKQVRNGTVQTIPGVGYIAANATYQFTYDGTNWLYTGNYDSNSNDNARYVQFYNTIVAGEALATASIIGAHTDGKFYQVKENASFDLASPLLWLTTSLAANATNYANIYTQCYDRNLATFYTSFVANTANRNKILYLVGTVNGNAFTTYGSNSSQYLTCTIPTTEDGRFYIPIGRLGNQSDGKNYFNYQVGVPVSLYAYVDGKFRQVTPTEIIATQKIYYRSKVNGNVPVPTTWITANGNIYNDTISVGTNGWSTKVTPMSKDKTSNTDANKYLYLYTCEQRKRLDGTVECLPNTNALLDESTTIIDGGNIITGSVTANQLNASNINASNMLTIGAFNSNTQNSILNSKVMDELVSRGEQLVINGNGFMGDNTNFPSLTFDGSESNCSPGSFTKSISPVTLTNDKLFPVDASKTYIAEFDVKAANPGAKMYSMLTFYDVDKLNINVQMVSYFPGSTTTLAQELKNGDTIVYLTSANGFTDTSSTPDHQRALIFWNYTNSFGYTYPPETYSRNYFYNLWNTGGINKTNNTITLKSAWTGGTFPAGTSVSQNSSGSTYSYFWSHTNISTFPREWTHISGLYNGISTSNPIPKANAFWPGTAYCKIGWLWNYQASNDQGQIWVTNISVREKRITSSETIEQTQQIYYRSSNSSVPSGAGLPTTWITAATDLFATTNTDASKWSLKASRLTANADGTGTKYPYLWTCTQKKTLDGTVSYGTIALDDTTTVIDGGKIITGSVQANAIKADSGTFNTANIPNLNASKITAGDIAANRIKTNVISAINSLTAGQIDAARIKASDLTIGESQVTNLTTDLTNAGKTATSYITSIDTNKGITLKPSDSSGNDYLQMNSTDIRFVRNNVDVMNLTDSSFRIGSASGYHSTVNTSGLHIWNGAESTATNEVASFGSTARVGKTNSSRFLMNADSLQGYNSSNKLYFEVSSNGIKYGTDLSASGTTNTVETTSGAQAKIDSLSISSTNLIRNGGFTNGSTYWVAAGSTLTTESDSTYGKVLKVVTSSGEYRTYPDVNTNFTHVSGETYSISFYGKASAATTIYVGIAGATSGNGLYKACSFTTSWQKFTATITASAAGSLSFKTTSGATFYLAKVMLVHGSKSMDWDADPRDVSSELIDAKKHTQVIISAANVDYVANTCTLTARLYIDGVLQTSTSLKWQWYRDGTAQGSQTTGATGSLSVTSALGIAHRYSCKCTF